MTSPQQPAAPSAPPALAPPSPHLSPPVPTPSLPAATEGASASTAPTGEGIVRVAVPVPHIEPFLSKALLFQRCDKAIIAKVAPHCEGLECSAGAVLITAGAANQGLLFLFTGSVSVRLTDHTIVETLQPGDHFGEAALLLDGASPYTVVVEEPSRILWLRAEVATNLFGKVPAISDAINRRLVAQVVHLCALERTQVSLAELAPDSAADLAPGTATPMPDLLDDGEGPPLETASSEAVQEPPLVGLIAQASVGPVALPAIPFVELSQYNIQPSVLSMVPTKLIRLHRLLPVRLTDHKLTVAMVAPRNAAALGELRRLIQTVELEVVAISADDFNQALVRLRLDPVYSTRSTRSGPSINPDSLLYETVAESERETAPNSRAVGDDVIKFVSKLVVAGLDREASDIHIEPTATGPRVRLRVGGVLQEWTEPIPSSCTMKTIAARIKVLAGLDITERRLPQDGRIGVTAGKRDVDLRVSTLPANRGEKIALRILEAAGSTRALEQIFIEQNTLAAARRALNRPYGGIVIAGPTGSGKTSSLYSLLNERKTARPDTNIIMVEDPIEYRLPGITQVQVSHGAGLGFARALRSILRQDPDVIVVGETRDHETAVLALEAAMTGHLLLTSLHANNAMSAIQRLENLGCGRTLIAQSMALIMVQRLVRKLCSSCRQLAPPPTALLESLVARRVVDRAQAALGLPRPVGCDACNQTGYVGRAVVTEALQINDEVRNALGAGKPLAEVESIALASKAFMPFSSYAAALMQAGVISPSEVLLAVAD